MKLQREVAIKALRAPPRTLAEHAQRSHPARVRNGPSGRHSPGRCFDRLGLPCGGEEAPSVVVVMGVPPREALGTVRLTLGRGTSREQVERAASALVGAWQALARA